MSAHGRKPEPGETDVLRTVPPAWPYSRVVVRQQSGVALQRTFAPSKKK